jgi:hypothetical protein
MAAASATEEGTAMSMSDTTMPAGADPETMDLAAVQAELQRYQPATSSSVIAVAEYMARRARLWRWLDELLGVRKPAIARPVAGNMG